MILINFIKRKIKDAVEECVHTHFEIILENGYFNSIIHHEVNEIIKDNIDNPFILLDEAVFDSIVDMVNIKVKENMMDNKNIQKIINEINKRQLRRGKK